MPLRWKLFLRRFKCLILSVIFMNVCLAFVLPSEGVLRGKFRTMLSTYKPMPTMDPNYNVPCTYPKPSIQMGRERWLEQKKCLNCSNERLEEVLGWEKDKNRSLEVYVKPEEDTLIKNGESMYNFNSKAANVVIVVFSAPGSFARRDAIRRTWAVTDLKSIRVGFLLGTTSNATTQSIIDKESLQYKDIIQENFHDSHKNLTIKSVMMLKWFLRNCRSARYLMKTDDDMIVIVSNLMKTLKFLKFPRATLFGMLVAHAVPFTNPDHKWYVSKYMYENDMYPNFLSGKGYVMSKSVAIKLFLVSLKTPLVHLEDVYLTGICADEAGIKRRDHLGFSNEIYLTCLPYHVITTKVDSPETLIWFWANRKNCSSHFKAFSHNSG